MIITMSLPMTDPGNWQDEMYDAAKRGAKVRRIFLNYLDDDCWNPNPNGPYLKIGEWNPGEIAGDAARNHVVPMYDMSQISPAFKDRLQWVALYMKSVGLIPWVVFDDWCSEVEEDYRQFHDQTYGNRQLHNLWNADPPSAARQYGGGNQALELNPYREALEAYVYSLFKAEGHTEIWGEPKNEYGYEEGEAYSFADMENWYRLRCEHLHKLGFKVVGSINGFITAGMIAPYIDLYDQHGIITTAEADEKMAENGLPYDKVIWNTDGSWSGEGTIPSYYDKYDMSEAQGETLGAYAKMKGTPHICYLCQSQIGPDHWYADDIDNRPVDGLKRGMEPDITPPDPDLVFLNVCTESLLLPNEYCPSVYAKSFIVGEEPTTVCTVHSKPDEEDTMWEQIMDWLFGDGSTWQKHPWYCVGGLLLVGFIIGAILL